MLLEVLSGFGHERIEDSEIDDGVDEVETGKGKTDTVDTAG